MRNDVVFGGSKIELDRVRETPSTVYIPLHLKRGLERLLKRKRLSMRRLLRHLLDRYEQALASGNVPPSPKGKKLYQEKGLDLQKMNFRPANGDWAELTIFAHSIGYARNHLFVRLLFLELLREKLIDGGIPTKPLAFLARKAAKLIHLSFQELLDVKRNLLGRKFAHDP